MVYLFHFYTKLHHAQHYIGFVEDKKSLKRRIKRHESGAGAKILNACNIAGIKYILVKTWDDADRNFERRLKNYKNAKRLCPLCNPNHDKINITLSETLGSSVTGNDTD